MEKDLDLMGRPSLLAELRAHRKFVERVGDVAYKPHEFNAQNTPTQYLMALQDINTKLKYAIAELEREIEGK